MENLVLIFWVIIILLSIISSIAKKKTPKKEGSEEEKQVLERLLGVFSDEEQPQPVIPAPVKVKVSRPPEPAFPPQPPSPPQPRRQPVLISRILLLVKRKDYLKKRWALI